VLACVRACVRVTRHKTSLANRSMSGFVFWLLILLLLLLLLLWLLLLLLLRLLLLLLEIGVDIHVCYLECLECSQITTRVHI